MARTVAFSFARGWAACVLCVLMVDPAFAGENNNLDEYTWLLVVAAFMAFFAAYGIGANDVANAFATSVGAKSLTVKQAIILASVCETLGAIMLGSNVAKTMRKGIADVECFEDNPGLIMYGMTCVIASVGMWLLLASFLEMPVSTTHSAVGGIIGMAMMSRGSECVVWYEESDDFPYVKGVAAIVVSWVLSPVASGFCAALLYAVTKFAVLNHENSFFRAKVFFPLLVGFTTGLNVVLMILKGAKGKAEDLGTEEMVAEAKDGDPSKAMVVGAISMAISAVLAAGFTPMLGKRCEEAIAALEASQPEATLEQGTFGPKLVAHGLTKDEFQNAKQNPNLKVLNVDEASPKGTTIDVYTRSKGTDPGAVGLQSETNSPSIDAAQTKTATSDDKLSRMVSYVDGEIHRDPHAILEEEGNSGIKEMHDNCQRHDAKTEEMFKYVQVFTAIVDSFSHGANDVANAMGPFSAVYLAWKTSAVSSSEDLGDNMYWILAIGGVGITVGLATYGYKIMSAIGVKLTTITPSRGYCIELGAAFVIIFGTTQGWPLSTTHCQVGATVGVGLFEAKKGNFCAGVNTAVLLRCVVGWVITLAVVGFTTAVLVGPSPEPLKSLYCAADEEGSSRF